MNLFRLGNFLLNSGKSSQVKIECDALTNEDWRCLAYLVRWLVVGPFSSVEGVPTGGLKLAEALEPHTTINMKRKLHLIVDDVLTTGRSMEKARPIIGPQDVVDGLQITGAVVFARGPCASWIRPLFQMYPGT